MLPFVPIKPQQAMTQQKPVWSHHLIYLPAVLHCANSTSERVPDLTSATINGRFTVSSDTCFVCYSCFHAGVGKQHLPQLPRHRPQRPADVNAGRIFPISASPLTPEKFIKNLL